MDVIVAEESAVEVIEIAIDGPGLEHVELIDLNVGAPKSALIIAFEEKARQGGAGLDWLLFEEDGAAPLDVKVLIEARHADITHHVHRARQIEVMAHYLGKTAKRAFPPSARVQTVLNWAVKVPEFQIDAVIAPEIELALQGETEELPKRAHIGRFVSHDKAHLGLDLIRGVIPNG